MGRKRDVDLVETLTGQVWDLDGTIVLILGPGRHDQDGARARCLILDEGPHRDSTTDTVDDWTVRWFNGRSDWYTKRLA